MSEIIQSVEDYEENRDRGHKIWCRRRGFKITTNKQVMKMLIDDESSCCESWDILASEKDFSEYIGAEIQEVVQVDEQLMPYADMQDSIDEGGSVMVNIVTNKGTIQFVAYNNHNGYYGHQVTFESTQLKIDECL